MDARTRKRLRLGGIVAGVILCALALGFLWWGLTPLGPTPAAEGALESDATVEVARTATGWTFTPASGEATAGFVFYPGGHVDARSYAPYARQVASSGFLVVVPVMPLSLAVLSPNAATRAVEMHPEIRRWVLGGHSLGGVMAARYADTRPGYADGLVLLASYPSGSTDLSDNDVTVASLVGTQDTVVNMPVWENARYQLPAQTRFDILQGGNHAQFGDYGPQPGDTPDPAMSATEQREATVRATLEVLRAE